MITLRKTNLRKAVILIAGLLATLLLLLAFSPVFDVQAIDTCGDGVCDGIENSDTCLQDCECVDNGIADPGEGCGCKDVVCADEDLITACGTNCGPNGECPDGLVCATGGVCWDAVTCAPLEPVIEGSGSSGDEEGPACLSEGAECESSSECCSEICEGVCIDLQPQ